MGNLDGKVAVISGAARGQGRSHAARLASDGADIIALDICRDIPTMDYPNASRADLDATVKEVESFGRRALAYEVDVREASKVKEAVDAGVAELGRLDIVLPQAGIVRYAKLGSIEENAAVWADILAVNVTGYFHLLEAAVPHLIEGGRGGVIVMTGSTAATRPTPGTGAATAYIAAKHGVVGIMKSYALALAKHNIRVNVVHPTGVASGMTLNDAMGKLAAEAAAGEASDDNWIANSRNLLDVELLQPSDITDAVAFLVSDQAKWITGEEIKIDAGFSLL
ncbi:MAG TPA: mycofactocin-coupled SDR family oxidoreductase [Amycolatopsis sp.]|nr:mycofactocin-coupled SDR family oxidoreductase [Amycolatopsis sp.]